MRRARTTGAPLRLRFLALFLQRKVKDAGRRPQLTWLAWGLALSDLHMFGTSVGAWYLPSSPQANDTIPSWQTPWSRSVAYRHAEEHGSVSDLLAAHIGSCSKGRVQAVPVVRGACASCIGGIRKSQMLRRPALPLSVRRRAGGTVPLPESSRLRFPRRQPI